MISKMYKSLKIKQPKFMELDLREYFIPLIPKAKEVKAKINE